MAEHEKVDAALLAGVTGFLAKYNTPNHQQGKASSAFSDDELVININQLLAESEVLLSAIENLPQEQIAPAVLSSLNVVTSVSSQRDTTKTDQLLSDQRRKHRNIQAAKRRQRYHKKTANCSEKEKMRYADNLSLSAWRAIAVLQKEKRLEAEQNHKQLRSAVVERARVIHQMKMLLQRFKADEGKNESREDGDQRFLFKALVGELDAIYARTHQTIREANFKICLAEAFIGKEMKNIVVTVPAYFNDSQADSLHHRIRPEQDGRRAQRADLRLGGGISDMSMLNTEKGIFLVKATAGDTHLGGEDSDNRLNRLSSAQTYIKIDSLFDTIEFNSISTHVRFENLCSDDFRTTNDPVGKDLRAS
ncbi:hypothetical protein PPTG_22662 [Phytophthora nicotianae INRA-310]|uniref:Uncharacterized protein n=1 Tax=Phytophthora nicotianae (strain INRA-310) TaxID=761204 RepID=W2QEB2_PHYN3|nr:hypothetical protein PPTG_22662 [Phytophthora nicotianae INRA-310]ETN10615.1 hypothetical protein PPTG_22662 [Phytophthora nicotianae INRA-310]